MESVSGSGPRLRANLTDIPGYEAGRVPQVPLGMVGYKLSSNENPFPPLPSVRAAMAEASSAAHRYPDPASTELIKALARHHEVEPDNLVLGTGSVALCYQAAQAAAGPGDGVLFAWRSFEAYPLLTKVIGARPIAVPLKPDGGHDLPSMAEAITPDTRLVFLCTPNNPTGAIITREDLDWFLARVPPELLVVIDEAYWEFVRDERAADGLTEFRQRENVVVLRTFSKAYGLAGLRVGYAVASPRVAAALRLTGLPFGVSSVAEYAAIASLAHQDELHRRVDAVVLERERVIRVLRSLGWPVGASQANFVWLSLGGDADPFAAACDKQGVAVRLFRGEGVRVTIGEPAANDRFLQVAESFRK